MGRVAKGQTCDVVGCDRPAVRSLASDKVGRAGLRVRASGRRRVYLCREHYKQVKKALKAEKRIEKWRYMR